MIPATAHFVWLGRNFPWMFAVAVHAATVRGGFARVILHHTDDLESAALERAKRELTHAELRKVKPEEILGAVFATDENPRRQPNLIELWRRLDQPAARSNLLRIAILLREGGVYLDTDVIALQSFVPLLRAGFFCGAERIALPALVARSRNPLRWILPGTRLLVRDLFRRLPKGHRWFRAIEKGYPAVVNNAVLGAEAGHPFLFALLERMLSLPCSRQTVRFALGTHLLEDMVRKHPTPDLVVHPPGVFYPLAPEISQHWFRLRDNPRLDEALLPETLAVHWYASVRTRSLLSRVDPDYVRAHAHRQLWSALVLPLLDATSSGVAA